MAEEQKPVQEALPELPNVNQPAPASAPEFTAAATADTAAAASAPAAVSATPTEAAFAADPTAQPADETALPPNADDKVSELRPVEEGFLAHKAQGASFPKNIIPSKEFFFFGSDALDPKALAAYQKNEKSLETAHDNIAWASYSGKGLLFIGDKKAPVGVINLADAGEPEVDGSNRFHFTSKGNKHTFKAVSVSERNAWIAQLKLKIAEAKQLAPSVIVSEAYKKTLLDFNPAPISKAEKNIDDVKSDELSKSDDPSKEDDPVTKDDIKDDSNKAGEPRRRSASRKRASFFVFGKKEEKKEEPKADEAAIVDNPLVANSTAAQTDTPAPLDTELPANDDKLDDEAFAAESPKEKPSFSKRNSFFSGVFYKKRHADSPKTVESSADVPADGAVAVTDPSAPVIPPMEEATPLTVDVSNAAPVSRNTDFVSDVDNKKDAKEKRKSSLPFAFGKREKSPIPADAEEKSATGKSAFSKLRATIKSKAASANAKAGDKPADDAVTESPIVEAEPLAPASSVDAVVKPAAVAEVETENKPESVAATAPAVTAAA